MLGRLSAGGSQLVAMLPATGHPLAAWHLAACAVAVGLLTRDLPCDGAGGAR